MPSQIAKLAKPQNVIGVTGTNGKSTTTRLLAHILLTSKKQCIYVTTEGVYENGSLISEKNYNEAQRRFVEISEQSERCLTNQDGSDARAKIALSRYADYHVLEIARGGLIRSGVPVSPLTAGVFLNVAHDHLGECGIETLADLAELKGAVVRCVDKSGHAILNWDDPLVRQVGLQLAAKKVWFSTEANALVELKKTGSSSYAVLVDGKVIIHHASCSFEISAEEIPISMGGNARFMIENAMAAILCALSLGIDWCHIESALASFLPVFANNPGRMNCYPFKGANLIVDFAHNNDGLSEVIAFLKASFPKSHIVINERRFANQDQEALSTLLLNSFATIRLISESVLTSQLAKYLRTVELSDSVVEFFSNEVEAFDGVSDEIRPGEAALLLFEDVAAATWLASMEARIRK